MALSAMDGTISTVRLFGQTVNLNPSITGYQGDTMYITGATVDANNVLVVTISDAGPPVMPTFPSGMFVGAYALVSYSGSANSVTNKTQNAVNYGGKPLILTGVVVPPPAGKYGQTHVTPVVGEWVSPAPGLEFVIVQGTKTKSQEHELRWFPTSIDAYETQSASVVPVPTGGGVQGPFGIETP